MDAEPLTKTPISARARFYFDHYQRIEEWAALRREAGVALHEQLVGLSEDLQAEVADRDDVLCRTADIDEGNYPRAILERPQWRQPGETSAPYGIALEWERNPIDRLGQVRLYVAVRGNTEHPRHEGVSSSVRERASTWKRQLPGTWTGNSAEWPCFSWVRPGDRIDEVGLFRRAVALQNDVLARLSADLDSLLTPP